jgi:glycosyltransferase involved in cell wall biosynthesis
MILNAVMCVWNEEDIIEATVRHAFAQGCSNVFIVDNASTDKTVEKAKNAGATLAASFESQYFDEIQKITHLNTVVRNHNEQSGEDYIWWMYIDADEFPNIDLDISIIDFIRSLDSSIRAVQGYIFEHMPTHQPYYVTGYHPIDFMQLSTKTDASKIPLLRYDKNKPHLYSAGGAHTFDTCGESIPVARDILNIHHFKYRKPEDTINRLKLLLKKNYDGTSRVDLMDSTARDIRNSPDALSDYHNRYNCAQSYYTQNKYKILMIDELQFSYINIARWYDPHKLRTTDDNLLSLGIHYLLLNDFDSALFKFNDILNSTSDSKMYYLLSINIAFCLCVSDKTESLSILQKVLQCPYSEISDYAKIMIQRIESDKVYISRSYNTVEFSIQNYYGQFDKKFFA